MTHITIERAKLEQWIEALNWSTPHEGAVITHGEAIAAIEAALAQEQEPVAIDWEHVARAQNAKLMAMCDQPGGMDKLRKVLLVAAQEQQSCDRRTWGKPWVSLTDEDKETLILKHAPPIHPDHQDDSMDELIEAAGNLLKEKNT